MDIDSCTLRWYKICGSSLTHKEGLDERRETNEEVGEGKGVWKVLKAEIIDEDDDEQDDPASIGCSHQQGRQGEAQPGGCIRQKNECKTLKPTTCGTEKQDRIESLHKN